MTTPPTNTHAYVGSTQALGASVLRSALLGNIHDAGVAVLHCIEGVDKDKLLSRPGTREKLLECLEIMRASARDLPVSDKEAMPDVDWDAWSRLQTMPLGPAHVWRDHLWRVTHQLVPDTLVQVRRYRQQLTGGWFQS
ncbi:hypothetical protein [Zoogloea sp.]|uniref:hypothetical protein n=1 Tax=Zoogloea sp. TaxID=49181 RepID=UPI0035B1EDE9